LLFQVPTQEGVYQQKAWLPLYYPFAINGRKEAGKFKPVQTLPVPAWRIAVRRDFL
jgi:hypothetical protein